MQKETLQQLAGASPVRRPSATHGSFGGIEFSFEMAIRRADDTVVVHVGQPNASTDLVERLLAVGVDQLALGGTTCRAGAVRWDAERRAVIFELHRAKLAEVFATEDDLASAA